MHAVPLRPAPPVAFDPLVPAMANGFPAAPDVPEEPADPGVPSIGFAVTHAETSPAIATSPNHAPRPTRCGDLLNESVTPCVTATHCDMGNTRSGAWGTFHSFER
jgi:hypothetical protein